MNKSHISVCKRCVHERETRKLVNFVMNYRGVEFNLIPGFGQDFQSRVKK